MPRKSYAKSGNTCRVTFELPPAVEARTAMLVGDFNDWDTGATPMTRRKDGRFSVTVSLAAERSYRYRYLLDGERWENDWEAEAYVRNEHGSEDSLVSV
ncbi:MAG TPA: isoamylase early set domain-containing protein [Acidimicrobiales bacterium]|nr:isoamylase early set domain-containing protein [Acidimicrobiales bacterium]